MNLTKTLTLLSLAASCLPSMASAEPPRIEGYLLDTPGKVVRSDYGLCWHTGTWTPALAIEECDPEWFKKAAVIAPPVEPEPTPKAVFVPEPETKVTPPPAAVIVPVAVPKRVVLKKVSFSADALFGFDKSRLRPAGAQELDNFAKDLHGVNYEFIYVTGHADRIGRSQYNQKLSERRANEVRNYLVSQNIPDNRIIAKGVGETEPTTQSNACAGLKHKKLITCLQPDRRVDIEVVGTK